MGQGMSAHTSGTAKRMEEGCLMKLGPWTTPREGGSAALVPLRGSGLQKPGVTRTEMRCRVKGVIKICGQKGLARNYLK